MYLWLCCEGWVRFGPFAWLYLDQNRQLIRDQELGVVARHDGTSWRADKAEGMHFSEIMITRTPDHPHPNTGE